MALIDLTKKVGIVLAKRNIPNVRAQVGMALDISGSMQDLYRSGAVQAISERLFALAVKFDDNATLDSWVFHNRSYEITPITEDLFETYVSNHILGNPKVDLWGGTSFAPMMKDIVAHYSPETISSSISSGLDGVKALFGFGKKAASVPEQQPDPAYIIIITDGENDDHSRTISIIEENADKNIYWEFVGIGNERFNFLREIADAYPNVGFVKIDDITTIDDDDLYMELLNEEMVAWIKKFS